MKQHWIKNWQQVAISAERAKVLTVAEAGLDAINTEKVLKKQIKLNGEILKIDSKKFDLAKFKHVYVLGFGKASAKAAEVLEAILGPKIDDGVVISIEEADCQKIRCLIGTHPLPSMKNVEAAKEMAALVEKVTADDLVICLVSGGGSALLCWTKEECEQGTKLYQNYLKTGRNIVGINTVRKHISQVKGGGLAKLLYPATVVGLIFSDISGDRVDLVDSGPTFKDTSTMYEAKQLVERLNLGVDHLYETPKEEKYFEKVSNLTLVSNLTALKAMKEKAEELGLDASILSAEIYSSPQETMEKFAAKARPGTLLLGGGEITLKVTKSGGKGGRNSYLPLYALPFLKDGDVFVSLGSDGLDNGDAAGAIVDQTTKQRIAHSGLSAQKYLENFNGYEIFEHLGSELLFTGPTLANVSDFLLYYRY